jgi:hypothetical protein
VGQNKRIKEEKNAWYAMIDGSALNNRLNFVAGLRSEDAKRTGFGPATDSKWNFLKLKDGTLYRDTANPNGVRFDQAASPLFATTPAGTTLRSALTTAGVTFPTTYTPITTNQLAGRMLQLKALQPVYGKSEGKPSYSINVAYDITKKLVGKVAWSRSFGRIPLESGTVGLLTGGGGGFTINEAETAGSIPAGTISVANPNLLPNISTNWDFALTYYTERGGKLGASYYTKSIKNFEEQITTTSTDPTFALVLDSLGLDAAEYDGWNITTAVNGIGTGKVSGYELEVFQDFRFIRQLGEWGKRINVFATYTHSKRSETNTTRISARPAASSLATAGFNFAMNRVTLNIKATWRDLTLTQEQWQLHLQWCGLPAGHLRSLDDQGGCQPQLAVLPQIRLLHQWSRRAQPGEPQGALRPRRHLPGLRSLGRSQGVRHPGDHRHPRILLVHDPSGSSVQARPTFDRAFFFASLNLAALQVSRSLGHLPAGVTPSHSNLISWHLSVFRPCCWPSV